jgi:hypothetical protein
MDLIVPLRGGKKSRPRKFQDLEKKRKRCRIDGRISSHTGPGS